MTNEQARLMAGAVLAAGGAIGVSIGCLARATDWVRGSGGDASAGIVMLGGAVLCIWSLVRMRKGKSE